MSLLTKVCSCFLCPSHPPWVRALPQAVATWRALCQVEEGALGEHWSSFSSRVSGLLPRVFPRDFPLCSLGLGRGRGAQGQARYCWAGAARGVAGGVGRAEPMGHCAGCLLVPSRQRHPSGSAQIHSKWAYKGENTGCNVTVGQRWEAHKGPARFWKASSLGASGRPYQGGLAALPAGPWWHRGRR